MKVLAVGAAGASAGLVTRALSAKGVQVRGLVHCAQREAVARQNGATETVVANLDDKAALAPPRPFPPTCASWSPDRDRLQRPDRRPIVHLCGIEPAAPVDLLRWRRTNYRSWLRSAEGAERERRPSPSCRGHGT